MTSQFGGLCRSQRHTLRKLTSTKGHLLKHSFLTFHDSEVSIIRATEQVGWKGNTSNGVVPDDYAWTRKVRVVVRNRVLKYGSALVGFFIKVCPNGF
jgi:hypothetical protein